MNTNLPPYGGQQPQFGPQQPFTPQQKHATSPKKGAKWIPWVAGGVSLLVGIVIGSAGGGTDTTTAVGEPAPTVTVTTTAAADPVAVETTPPPPPAAVAPTKAKFKLTLKILKKQCFGSAGCNVTYRVVVAYNGSAPDPSETYEVVYEVRGGDDGTSTNSFTMTGSEYSIDSEESVSTPSKNTKLTAVVTDVI